MTAKIKIAIVPNMLNKTTKSPEIRPTLYRRTIKNTIAKNACKIIRKFGAVGSLSSRGSLLAKIVKATIRSIAVRGIRRTPIGLLAYMSGFPLIPKCIATVSGILSYVIATAIA